jgi:hypothetical protein
MKNIYNLISFSQAHVDAWEKYHDTDESVRHMTDQEREEFNKTFDRHSLRTSMSIGKAYRGSFLDRDALIKIIESQDDVYGICEGYYDYLLIEKHNEGIIDGLCCHEDDSEIWYKADYSDEKFRYVRTEKPRGFTGTVFFT